MTEAPKGRLPGLGVFLLFWGFASPLVALPLTRGYQPRLGLFGSLPDMVLLLGGSVFAYDGLVAFCLFLAALGGSMLVAATLSRR